MKRILHILPLGLSWYSWTAAAAVRPNIFVVLVKDMAVMDISQINLLSESS